MIYLVSDYHAGLPDDWIAHTGVTLIPSYVAFGHEFLMEGHDFSQDEFYERLESSSVFPRTLPPDPDEFAALYESLLGDSPDDQVISIHFSGGMSDIVANAIEGSESMDGRVHVFDTQTVGVPEALMVLRAAELIAAGADVPTILQDLESMRDDAKTFFILDTLEYLERGGRIGKAAALVGKVLSAKPVLTVHDGVVTSYARFNERDTAIKNLLDLLHHVTRKGSRIRVGVAHAACLEDAQALADQIIEVIDPEYCLVCDVSPAVGAHVGPRTLSVGWWLVE